MINVFVSSLTLALSCAFFVFAENPSSKFLPPDGKTFLFIGHDNETISNYIKKVDSSPHGIMVYTAVNDIRGLYEEADHGAGLHHAHKWHKKYPDLRFQIGLYMVGNLKEVVAGKWDNNLGELARWIKEVSVPVYLRIGYEFDLPDNHYDPQEYKKAFRHIVDFMRAAKITNVAFVWHSYGYIGPGRPPINWYPGDEYVDWFGISFFKAFNTSGYKSFLKLAQEHGKPFMIAEATPFQMGTGGGKKSWAMWFKPFFEFIESNDIPLVCYINVDWESQPMFKGQGWGDARIEENNVVNERWRKKIKEDRYQTLKK